MNIAIIITFKRQELLQNLLTSIVAQKIQFDFVYIVDNENSILTYNIVNQLKRESFIYLSPTLNLGCSGGFKYALEIILKKYQTGNIIFLDDDISLRSDFLLKMTECSLLKDGNCVLPSKVYKDGSDFVWAPILSTNKLFVKRHIEFADNEKNYLQVENITFEACVLPISIIRDIGLPDERFFIDGDDFEYGIRINQKCKIFKLKDILVVREIKVEHEIKIFNFFSIKMKSQRSRIGINRLYYEIRNKYLIGETLGYTKLKTFLFITPYYIRLILGQLLFRENKLTDLLQVFYLSNLHGFINRYGIK